MRPDSGGAVALAGASATTAEAAAIHWNMEADVVVLGSGAAGMPAAVAAVDAGASVIVVEKNYDVGGRGILSGGRVQLGCGNPMQVAAGVHDSPDQFFLDWTESEGHYPVDPKLWGTERESAGQVERSRVGARVCRQCGRDRSVSGRPWGQVLPGRRRARSRRSACPPRTP